ncbi:MAG: tautomerase family protein [Spirochaetales bacterium]|nr:tautomerase family protein [Spirochaetales bacterium]
MPHIAVTMYPGRSEEIKSNLADKIQKCVINELGIDSKVVSVSIEEIKPENWQANVDKFKDNMYIEPGN